MATLNDVVDSSGKSRSLYDEDSDMNPKMVTFTYSDHPSDEIVQSIQKNIETVDKTPSFLALEDISRNASTTSSLTLQNLSCRS